MKDSVVQKATDSETAIWQLRDAATKIRRRDVTRWAGKELRRLAETMGENP